VVPLEISTLITSARASLPLSRSNASAFPVPVIRVGRLIRVPTAALRRLLDADDDLENPTVTDQYDDDPTTEPLATPALRLVPRPELAHQRTQAAPRPERNGGHP
jgi:hypothetical protein